MLIGYDPLPQAAEHDPSGDGSSSARAGSGGGSDAGIAPSAGNRATAAPLDGSADAGAAEGASGGTTGGGTSDGGPIAAMDASPTGPRPAIDDAASAEPPSACPDAQNACGGCAPLANPVGSGCGVCGLGRYVCDGSDAVRCEGGAARPVATGTAPLIDDLEDGDRYIAGVEGRSGGWYTTDDGSGGVLAPDSSAAFTPAVGGYGGSRYAARMSGSGFRDWGAALALSLSAYQCTYDARAYRGISFYARGSGTAQFSLATARTLPPEHGGICTANCFDHFSASVPLTSSWVLHRISWNQLAQSGWGTPAWFFPSELVYIELAFAPNAVFDVWLDEIAFF